MEQVYSIWKTGYSVNTALGVLLIGETEKAYKFKVLNTDRDYTFFMPKKALKFDTKNEGIIELARWFRIEGFLSFVFDRYANHFAR